MHHKRSLVRSRAACISGEDVHQDMRRGRNAREAAQCRALAISRNIDLNISGAFGVAGGNGGIGRGAGGGRCLNQAIRWNSACPSV